VLAVYSAGKKDGPMVDSLYVSIVIMCTIANKLLFIINPLQCHQVSTFARVRAVVFSAFSMHHARCKRSAIRKRNCR